MSNNQLNSIEWIIKQLIFKTEFENLPNQYVLMSDKDISSIIEQAKAMQQEQAQLYATFVLKCVNNNLPPITFNDWINLENNEQQ